MKRLAIIIIAALATTVTTFGQKKFELAYPMAFGIGDLGDFISEPSFRGISIDYRQNVTENIAIGTHLGWHTFYSEQAKATYTRDNQSLTGKQYRYSNNFPLLVTGTYYLSPDAFVSPFASLGLGTVYTRRNTDMNLYTVEQEAWNFALHPEVGVHLNTADEVGVVISLKYLHGFTAGDFDADQSYLSLAIGLCFY